eukprot:gb/GFBE01023126.1/.p1 GENE.gb/GFBE01023126.1/~~gb/GFBE01023126.1/.p1  ORF type:complete len:492 (+),score=131.67 gb/GFBE01023126.1/:1-1476(+)
MKSTAGPMALAALAAPATAFLAPTAPVGSTQRAAGAQLEAAVSEATAPSSATGASTGSQGLTAGLLCTSGLALAAAARRQRRQKVAARASAVSLEEKRFPVLTKRPPVGSFPKLPGVVHPGVVTGRCLRALLDDASERGYAIPAVNCVSSSSINACLEAARKADAPIMIQFSAGGAQFYAGKALDNTNCHAAVTGAVAGAYHVRAMAEQYGVPVVLHTDHCAKNLLPWFEGLLQANERYFETYGEPLFSSHMLDLSEEPLEENIEICVKYMERMAKINCALEMELGITGGEEDGVDNSDASPEDLYSKPEEIFQVYEALSKVPNAHFTIAAAFGNVHGVYSPGNVKLDPEILGKAQAYVKEKTGCEDDKPVRFVFHGGSGSELSDIRKACSYGVIKMNIDTDTQWAFWDGMNQYQKKNVDYLQAQIGNPEGPEKPNKKYYDPRACMRSAEESTIKRLERCFEDLNCKNVLGLGPPDPAQNVLGPSRGGLPA